MSELPQILDLATDSHFDWSVFAVGGPQSGFSSPDNLSFDDEGTLWMCTDVSDSKVNRGIYRFLGNNAMFTIPTSGPNRGTAYRFASGPIGCELTGPSWTPDGSTLFLSVQHPGGNWPGGGTSVPRASVVASQGFAI
jgi:secreted PhoX family phosphatase